MSMGFTEIAVDDAKPLLEQTVVLIDELATIYTESESMWRDGHKSSISKADATKEKICKMKCLRSERAATMALFDKKKMAACRSM